MSMDAIFTIPGYMVWAAIFYAGLGIAAFAIGWDAA